MWEDARATIQRQLGVETLYIENVFVSNFEEAVEMLSMQDVDAIISTSHFFAGELQDIAGQYRDIVFISYGGELLAPNISTFRPLLYQPSHVAGLAAGYNTANGVDRVGVIVDENMYNAPGVVNAFIRGTTVAYRAGVQVHVRAVNSRDRQMVEEGIRELRTEGVDTILSYIDTDYALAFAERNGINVVGYTNNIEELAAVNHVAGFGFNANLYLTEQISKIQHGNFSPTAVKGDIDSGYVFLSELNSNERTVLPDTFDLVEELLARVINGEAPIFVGEMMDRHGNVQIPRGAVLTIEEILNMKWYEYSIGGNTFSMTEPFPAVPIVPLIIRGDGVTNTTHGNHPPPATTPPEENDNTPEATTDRGFVTTAPEPDDDDPPSEDSGDDNEEDDE
jgi:basic membrane lipoprotein Med (substrate-binding protein (PBP1-ABC) superfamily)